MSDKISAAQYLEQTARNRTGKRNRRADLEGPVHRSIIAHLELVLMPPFFLHHSPNELNMAGQNAARLIKKNKEMGMLKGFPDIIVMLPGPFLIFLEVKPPGAYPDPDQKKLHADLIDMGFALAVVRSIEDVNGVLKQYGIKTREVSY